MAKNEDILGRPFEEIEDLLASIPHGPETVPDDHYVQARGLCAAAAHTNYLLAAILLELREIRTGLLPEGRAARL